MRYYNSVLKAAAVHRKTLRDLRHYFWMRPVLLSRGQPVLTFTWHDTYPQTAELLQSLQQSQA